MIVPLRLFHMHMRQVYSALEQNKALAFSFFHGTVLPNRSFLPTTKEYLVNFTSVSTVHSGTRLSAQASKDRRRALFGIVSFLFYAACVTLFLALTAIMLLLHVAPGPITGAYMWSAIYLLVVSALLLPLLIFGFAGMPSILGYRLHCLNCNQSTRHWHFWRWLGFIAFWTDARTHTAVCCGCGHREQRRQ